jgi:ankyrin repeat protein
MKHLLLTTIAAVLLVGCGESQPPEPPTAKAPDISIHGAAKEGNIEAVKQHLTDGVDVNSKSDIGKTPLDVAIAFKQSLITDLLRKHDGKTRDELKAAESIWNAIEVESIEATKQHIAKGADVNANRSDGATPLDVAHHPEIANLLRKHGGKSSVELSIHVAAMVGNIEAVKQHLDAGTDVNAKNDKDGGTPLHEAAMQGHKQIVELLIAAGARVNAVDFEGETSLDNAIFWRDSDTADLLRKHGGKTGEELKAEGK